jgi:hypothetical protein
MEALRTSTWRDWMVSIHCSPSKAGFYRSVAWVRAPQQIAAPSEEGGNEQDGIVDAATLLETPGNFYRTASMSNAAALASARRSIDAADVDPAMQ